MVAEADTADVTARVVGTTDGTLLGERNTGFDIAHLVWPEGLPGETSRALTDRGFGVEVPVAVDIADKDSH